MLRTAAATQAVRCDVKEIACLRKSGKRLGSPERLSRLHESPGFAVISLGILITINRQLTTFPSAQDPKVIVEGLKWVALIFKVQKR